MGFDLVATLSIVTLLATFGYGLRELWIVRRDDDARA